MSAGTRLGRYEIVSDLGAGGMATVYLGRALSVAGFQRLVAIKLLHPHLLRDETFVQMFLDEGRLAARIHHPNVVGTLDLERSPEGLYIVSEYIEGDQLLGLYKSARATEQRIPRGIALRIALDVLAGLQAAHELTDDLGAPLKIVHRDVSPHNILVGSDGISRLTDFGIAKAEERIADTRDGIVKGKLSYMAPEQPNDGPIDRRADLFALGTVLWECLTGRRLFPGKTDAEVLQSLLNKPIPRLRAVDPELPEALDGVLARALDRDPERRWQSAREFADALEAAVSGSGVASYRVVAEHVKQVAAPKIIAEHERRRATTRDLPAYRPSAESLRSIAAIPSPGRPTMTPPEPAPLIVPAHADEAPTQIQSASVHLLPPTMPTARSLVAPPPLPLAAKMVAASPETPTARPPSASEHRTSGARPLPPLPPLTPPSQPAKDDAATAKDDAATATATAKDDAAAVEEPMPLLAEKRISIPPTLISSPALDEAAAVARLSLEPPVVPTVAFSMPASVPVPVPAPMPVRQAEPQRRGGAWIFAGVVLLGVALGLVIWKAGFQEASSGGAAPAVARAVEPTPIVVPPLDPPVTPVVPPPAVAMESAPAPEAPIAEVPVAPPVAEAPVVVPAAPSTRAPLRRPVAPIAPRAPVPPTAPVARPPVVVPVLPAPVVTPTAPSLPTSI